MVMMIFHDRLEVLACDRAPSAGLNRIRFQGFDLNLAHATRAKADAPGGLCDYNTPRLGRPQTKTRTRSALPVAQSAGLRA
jgi:hypothetical protein